MSVNTIVLTTILAPGATTPQEGVSSTLGIDAAAPTVSTVRIASSGPRGMSAYEIAVNHGYTGTESQWLLSLQSAGGVWGTIAGNLVDQTDLQAVLNSKATSASLSAYALLTGGAFTGAISATNLSGTNTGDETAAGILSKLAAASGSTTTFLRADGTWATVATGGGTWGSITGTLSNQTDLNSALNSINVALAAKADASALAAKANLAGATFSGAISATNLSGTNTGDETSTTILSKLSASSGTTTGFLRGDGTWAAVASGASSVSTQSGTAYTATLSDANTFISFSNASPTTFTIPPNSSVAFPVGTELNIEQAGTGALSVAAGAGVTINARDALPTLNGQYAFAALKQVSANSWVLVGDLKSATPDTTTNAVTFSNSGSGAASGTTFDGSAARTISYNTIGAQPAGSYLTGNQTITLSGDISGSGSTAITASIGANKVNRGMLAATSAAGLLGATAAGNVSDLTPTQVTALLNSFTSALQGLVPASGGGTTNFLRADGTWAAPPGGGAAAWGSITGTLSSQTDLNSALSGKQPLDATLTAAAGLTWTAGTQVPVMTATDTFSLKTVGSATGNLLDKAAGDTLYQPVGSYAPASGSANYQASSALLTAYAGQAWSAGVQVPTLTSANTIALKTVGSATGNLLDKAAGDGLYKAIGYAPAYTEITSVPTGTVFYRKTAATGAAETQTLATLKTDLGLTGTNSGDQTITLTGDITGSGTGSFATAIGSNKVNRGMLAATSAAGLLGATAAGNVSDLTPTQVTALLNGFTSALQGVVPASGGGTTNFLRADGTWAAPPASGAGTTTNAVTFNSSGTGAASGSTFDGSVTRTISYNTIGAQVAGSYQTQNANLTAYAGANWAAGTQIPALTAANTIALKTVGSATGNILDKAAGDSLYQPLGNYLVTGSQLQTILGNTGVAELDVRAIGSGGISIISNSNTLSGRIVFSDPSGNTAFSLQSSGALLNFTSNTVNGFTGYNFTGTVNASSTIQASNFASGASVSGTNTGDETTATIKTKLGITTLSGSNTGDQTITLTGDVTGSGTGSFATAIGSNKVTRGMLTTAAAASLVGATAAGNVSDLTGTQATTLLDTFTSSLKGLAPASGGGTTNFLRADGTWAAPPGGGAAAWGSITGTLSSQTDLNSALAAKAPLASPTFTGTVTTAASATGGAGLNLPHGVAPTAPVNGDLWTTTTGANVRINGSTKGIALLGNAASFSSISVATTFSAPAFSCFAGDIGITPSNFASTTLVFGGIDGNGNCAPATLKTGNLPAFIGDTSGPDLTLAAGSGVGPNAGANVIIQTPSTTTTGALQSLATRAIFNQSGLAVTGALSATGALSGSNLSGTNTGDETSSTMLTKLAAASGGGTTNFLRADGTWAAPPSGGAAAWGSITGTLSAQTDLNTALAAKAPTASPTFTGTVATTTLSAATINAKVSDLSIIVPNGLWLNCNSGSQHDFGVNNTSRLSVTGTGASVNGTLAVTDKFTATTSQLAFASFNVPHGTAPTSPVNGDMWTTTAGVFWRINGATVQTATGGGTATGTNTGDQTITLTGDVTGSGTGSFATAIGANKVTRGMLATAAAAGLLGATAAGNVSDLTPTQVTAMLNVATQSLQGMLSATDKTKLDGIASGATANTGTVTSVSVTTANGVSGTVATNTTTPAISLTLGAITPSSVAASGTVAGSNLSGTNTGDETASTITTKIASSNISTSGTISASNKVDGFTLGITGKPTTSQRFLAKAPYAFTVSGTNSSATALVAATASTVFTLKKGTVASPTTIGTFTFAASGTTATVSISAGAVSAGDVVWVEAPATADTTCADISFLVRA